MTEVLKSLQALQAEAFAKGIYAFSISARCIQDDERENQIFISVYIFLKGDDSEEDYFSQAFYPFDNRDAVDGKIQEIRDFINI